MPPSIFPYCHANFLKLGRQGGCLKDCCWNISLYRPLSRVPRAISLSLEMPPCLPISIISLLPRHFPAGRLSF